MVEHSHRGGHGRFAVTTCAWQHHLRFCFFFSVNFVRVFLSEWCPLCSASVFFVPALSQLCSAARSQLRRYNRVVRIRLLLFVCLLLLCGVLPCGLKCLQLSRPGSCPAPSSQLTPPCASHFSPHILICCSALQCCEPYLQRLPLAEKETTPGSLCL